MKAFSNSIKKPQFEEIKILFLIKLNYLISEQRPRTFFRLFRRTCYVVRNI